MGDAFDFVYWQMVDNRKTWIVSNYYTNCISFTLHGWYFSSMLISPDTAFRICIKHEPSISVWEIAEIRLRKNSTIIVTNLHVLLAVFHHHKGPEVRKVFNRLVISCRWPMQFFKYVICLPRSWFWHIFNHCNSIYTNLDKLEK